MNDRKYGLGLLGLARDDLAATSREVEAIIKHIENVTQRAP